MTTATWHDDPFRPRTREKIEQLRHRPTPALSECRTLSVEDALSDSAIQRELRRAKLERDAETRRGEWRICRGLNMATFARSQQAFLGPYDAADPVDRSTL